MAIQFGDDGADDADGDDGRYDCRDCGQRKRVKVINENVLTMMVVTMMYKCDEHGCCGLWRIMIQLMLTTMRMAATSASNR